MNTQNSKEILSQEVRIGKYKGKYFSWSAVIVAALVGIGISFLLNLFGIAIGLTAFTTSTTTSNLTFAIGGFLGLLVASVISMGLLGWVAGYLGALKRTSCNTNVIHCNYGSLYGFTAWSLALILSILLSTQVGKFISYTISALENPAVAVEKYTYPQKTNQAVNQPMFSDIQTTSVKSEEAKKTLAVTAFAAFILFFVGAFSASLAGHIAFERCLRKHGYKIE